MNSLALDTYGYGEQDVRCLVHAGMLEVDLSIEGERGGCDDGGIENKASSARKYAA